jgi:segregation and condensation protein A
VAATLLAGLEMARDGALSLRQEQPFGPILVRRREMDMPGLEGT